MCWVPLHFAAHESGVLWHVTSPKFMRMRQKMSNRHSVTLKQLVLVVLATLLVLTACGPATTPTAMPSPAPTGSAGGVPTTATTKPVAHSSHPLNP